MFFCRKYNKKKEIQSEKSLSTAGIEIQFTIVFASIVEKWSINKQPGRVRAKTKTTTVTLDGISGPGSTCPAGPAPASAEGSQSAGRLYA